MSWWCRRRRPLACLAFDKDGGVMDAKPKARRPICDWFDGRLVCPRVARKVAAAETAPPSSPGSSVAIITCQHHRARFASESFPPHTHTPSAHPLHTPYAPSTPKCPSLSARPNADSNALLSYVGLIRTRRVFFAPNRLQIVFPYTHYHQSAGLSPENIHAQLLPVELYRLFRAGQQ